jgi:hypothetical protein
LKGRRELDLLVDPPLDLIIEIDVTTDSMKKLGIYAALGFLRYGATTVRY